MTPDPKPGDEPTPSPKAQEIIRKATGDGDGAEPTAKGGKGNDAEPTPNGTPETITVDWGGAKRTVPVSELVQAAIERERTQQLAEQAQQLLAQNAAFQAFGQAVERLDPEAQQALLTALEQPDLLKQAVGPKTSPRSTNADPTGEGDGDDEDLTRMIAKAALGNEPDRNGNTPVPPDVQRRLDTIENALQMLVRQEVQRAEQTRQQTLAQQVEQKMAEFSIFKELEPMAKLARENILLKLASDPNADLDRVVAEHAAKATDVANRLRANQGTPSPADSDLVLPGPPDKVSGDDLLSGRLRERLKQQLDKMSPGYL